MNDKSQAGNQCISCKKYIKSNEILCDLCSKNPFRVEESRNILASDKPSLFTKFYSTKYPEIKNVNSGEFWDEKFSEDTTLSEQGPMTKDKINNIKNFIPNSTVTLLDIGFGMGYIEEVLENSPVQVSGLDISEDAVARARKKFKGKFTQGDIKKIKAIYKNSHFNTIVALELIEHISPSKIFGFMKDTRSLLKKNGIFIISTPLNEHLEEKKNNPSGHVREYTVPILKREFELSGFKVLKIKTFYAFGKYYSLKKLLTKVLPGRWEPNNVIIVAKKV